MTEVPGGKPWMNGLERAFLSLTLRDLVEVDHPGWLWRRALPSDVRVFAWWGPPRSPQTARPSAGWSPYVAWYSAAGWQATVVFCRGDGRNENLWREADWGERALGLSLAHELRAEGPEPSIEGVMQRVANQLLGDGPDPWALERVGALAWGLLRLLGAPRTEAARGRLLRGFPNVAGHLVGYVGAGVVELGEDAEPVPAGGIGIG